MARKTLTNKTVSTLKPKAKAYTVPRPWMCRAITFRVLPSGNKSFTAVARDPSGKQKWVTIGNAAHLDIDDARVDQIGRSLISLRTHVLPENDFLFDEVGN